MALSLFFVMHVDMESGICVKNLLIRILVLWYFATQKQEKSNTLNKMRIYYCFISKTRLYYTYSNKKSKKYAKLQKWK